MMKRIKSCLIILVISVLALAAGNWQANVRIDGLQRQICRTNYGLQSVIHDVLPSVVYIKVDSQYGKWSGSGAIIGPHTVLTAKHVIEGGDIFVITDIHNNEYQAISYAVDPDNDCGVLFFEEELDPIVKFANGSLLGSEVFIVGSPFGYDFFNTITTGIVSGLGRDVPYFAKDLMLTVDAASSPGNSGGPVFDMQGQIIGIVVGGMWGGDDLSILISADTCGKMLERIGEIPIKDTVDPERHYDQEAT